MDRPARLQDRDTAVVVAVVPVWVVQMAVDQVVNVVAVGHRLVTAAGTMHVVRRMTATCVIRGARCRVHAVDLEHVLIDVPFVWMVQVSVV